MLVQNQTFPSPAWRKLGITATGQLPFREALRALFLQLLQHLSGRLVTEAGGLLETGTGGDGVAKHVIERAQVILSEECPAALHTLVLVGFTQSQAALEGTFDPWKIGNIFGGIAANLLHVKQTAGQMEIGEIFQRVGSSFDQLQ